MVPRNSKKAKIVRGMGKIKEGEEIEQRDFCVVHSNGEIAEWAVSVMCTILRIVQPRVLMLDTTALL